MTILIKLCCTLFQRKDDFGAKVGNFGHSQQYVTFTYIFFVGNRWLRGQKSHDSKSLDNVMYPRRAEKVSLRSANNLSQLSWGTPYCSRFWTQEVFVLEAISCLPNNLQLEVFNFGSLCQYITFTYFFFFGTRQSLASRAKTSRVQVPGQCGVPQES